MSRLSCIFLFLGAVAPLAAQSVFPLRPDDPHAVYLQPGSFGAVGDGHADDTAAIQAAIDRVQETTVQGIVFVAEGRYRITHTVYLWSGIRLIGYGGHRPVFVLGPNTPGYQQGHGFLGTGRYMLQFAERRPPPGQPVVDANEFTFYSGIFNVDFEIGPGNPAAIAIRFHVAQHSFLEHMRFEIGDGRAALEDIGNGASDLHIQGGDYGIITVRTAPTWQFLLTDSSFTGQRRAAIHTQEAGMTLVRDRIANTPVAVEITPGKTEELYARDLVLQDITRSALVLGDAQKPLNEITLDHIICRKVPELVENQPGTPGTFDLKGSLNPYVEDHLTIGEMIGPDGRERGIQIHHREHAGAALAVGSDIPPLPPMSEWVNVHTLGVKGDGSDDTAALQAAIDSHRVLYFPSGTYRVSNTLHLRPDTALVGFNPGTTVIAATNESSNFTGEGAAVPVVESAKGGAAIISGIGITTAEMDHRAAGLLWRAGPHSMIDDVNLRMGFAFRNSVLAPNLPQPAQRPHSFAEYRQLLAKSVDQQYPSLWVTDGGGGIFRGIWTSNTLAKAGLLVENTTTPSTVYQMSCEHHMFHETEFHFASNWTVYALQTEEENPAGVDSYSIDLQHAQHMLFANTFMYRVSRQVLPKLNAVESAGSTGIDFENVHTFSMTRLAYDNSIFDQTSGVRVRDHDFAAFTVGSDLKAGAPLPLPAGIFAPGAKLQRLADGFSNADGLTVDGAGNVYFTDAVAHSVHRWNAETKKEEILSYGASNPMAAAYAGNGTLLVLDYSRSVYAVDTSTGSTKKIEPVAAPVPGTDLLLPVGLHNSMETLQMQLEHRGFVYSPRSNLAIMGLAENQLRSWFYAPGTTAAIMAGGDWLPQLQASQWRLFHVGSEHFAVSEDDDAVYRVRLDSLDHITTTQFAARGGTSVVTDTAGNVYVASGQIYIYNSAGRQIGVVEIPERPGSLAFGGPDRKTLFMGARNSLFSLRTVRPGN
ncbi:MAG TPA: glycosyl hydrolase family 28-related protein [Terracidiphilus sp.]|nr:glycosyl hydrolase family 28-related protein [Terracidiphilus sp.]